MDFALLLGTDYTKRFDRRQFKPLLGNRGFPLGYSEKMLTIMLEQLRGSHNRLSTSNSKLAKCMRYSLALFNVDPRLEESYHNDDERRINRIHEICGQSCPYDLSDLQLEAITTAVSEYIDTIKINNNKVFNCLDLTEDILTRDADQGHHMFPLITDEHGKAFQAMISLLKGEPRVSVQKLSLNLDEIQYFDVVATNIYQIIVKRILKIHREWNEQRLEDQHSGALPLLTKHLPYEFYNGKIFHGFLQADRRSDSSGDF